jgi:hypothetical protein
MLVSQPVLGSPSQFRKAPLQVFTSHEPESHLGVPLLMLHSFPHPPQWLVLVSVLVSQPSA